MLNSCEGMQKVVASKGPAPHRQKKKKKKKDTVCKKV
jgi:hypothetical protein